MAAGDDAARLGGIADIDVDEVGGARLYLDGRMMGYVAIRPSAVVRLLLDYASALDTELIVTTRHADGRHARHHVSPSGIVTAYPHELASPEAADCERERQRYGGTSRQAGLRSRVAARRSWAASIRWIAAHGPWLMLCTEILLLVGCFTFIVVALHKWSPS